MGQFCLVWDFSGRGGSVRYRGSQQARTTRGVGASAALEHPRTLAHGAQTPQPQDSPSLCDFTVSLCGCSGAGSLTMMPSQGDEDPFLQVQA